MKIFKILNFDTILFIIKLCCPKSHVMLFNTNKYFRKLILQDVCYITPKLAIKYNSKLLIDHMRTNGYNIDIGSHFLKIIKTCNLDFIKYMIPIVSEWRKLIQKHKSIICMSSNTHIILYLFENGRFLNESCYYTIINNNNYAAKTIKDLHSIHKKPEKFIKLITSLINNNIKDIELVKYLKNNGLKINKQFLNYAVESDNLEYTKWIFENVDIKLVSSIKETVTSCPLHNEISLWLNERYDIDLEKLFDNKRDKFNEEYPRLRGTGKYYKRPSLINLNEQIVKNASENIFDFVNYSSDIVHFDYYRICHYAIKYNNTTAFDEALRRLIVNLSIDLSLIIDVVESDNSAILNILNGQISNSRWPVTINMSNEEFDRCFRSKYCVDIINMSKLRIFTFDHILRFVKDNNYEYAEIIINNPKNYLFCKRFTYNDTIHYTSGTKRNYRKLAKTQDTKLINLVVNTMKLHEIEHLAQYILEYCNFETIQWFFDKYDVNQGKDPNINIVYSAMMRNDIDVMNFILSKGFSYKHIKKNLMKNVSSNARKWLGMNNLD